MFDLEVSFIQDFEKASIVKVMVEWYGKVGVCDGSDKNGVFDER